MRDLNVAQLGSQDCKRGHILTTVALQSSYGKRKIPGDAETCHVNKVGRFRVSPSQSERPRGLTRRCGEVSERRPWDRFVIKLLALPD